MCVMFLIIYIINQLVIKNKMLHNLPNYKAVIFSSTLSHFCA